MNSRLHVEELEPRILYSADAAALLGVPAPLSQSLTQSLPAGSQHSVAFEAQLNQTSAREIVFVDARVPNAMRLVDEIVARRDAERMLDVVMLTEGDALVQIESVLGNEQNLRAIHIISHGSSGSLAIGDTVLDANELLRRRAAIAAWGQALCAEGDILLYGCDVAQGELGRSFIHTMADLTGADVAASHDLTGAAGQGGDWTLEENVGQVATQTLLSDPQTPVAWEGTLNLRPQGGETLVNTVIPGPSETAPTSGQSVALAANGSSVVVFTDYGSTGGDVFAQRYDAFGATIGGLIAVNTSTLNGQDYAAVAMAADGRFVVVWSDNGQDGDGLGIYARVFDASGSAVTSEFQVNAVSVGSQDSAAVAMANDGSFAVTFTSFQAGSNEIVVRRFAASGAAIGGDVMVNSTSLNEQLAPAIAMHTDGSFVVVWMSYADDDALPSYGIYGQRFSSTGVALGGEFLINTTTAFDQTSPTIGMDGAGKFTVAWGSDQQDADGSYGIFARQFDANGVALGSEFQIHTTTTSTQSDPSIAVRSDGQFVVTWESFGHDAPGTLGIYARRFDAAAASLGAEILVNSHTLGDQRWPSVAMVGNSVVIVWAGGSATDLDGGVSLQRFSIAGITVGPLVGSVTEAGGTATFTVVLTDAPSADVTLTILLPSTPLEFSVSATSLTFTSANWNNAQTVTVTGLDDSIVDGNRAFVVTLSAAVSVDTAYNGLNPANVAGVNLDDDVQSTIVVNTVNDVVDGDTSSLYALYANPGADLRISLREAMIAANNSPNGPGGEDRIHFNIADALVSGAHTINLTSALPALFQAVSINAATEPDWATASRPVVVLTGGGTVDRGLRLYAGSDGSSVRGLVIHGFVVNGIDIASSHGNTVTGNYVGTDQSGTNAVANQIGINVWNSNNTQIGLAGANQGNLISGNSSMGVYVGGGSTGTRIQANTIGLNAAGSAAIPNGRGVMIETANGSVVGGTTAAARNVISGNLASGVDLLNGAAGNSLLGNYIGTDASGLIAIGNEVGVNLSAAGVNAIGGGLAGERNVVAGNTRSELRIQNGGGDTVRGNFFGTDRTGNAALSVVSANAVDFANTAVGITFGGSSANQGNVVAGWFYSGPTASGGYVLEGNRFGIQASGTGFFGISGGVYIDSSNTRIGGTAAGAGNTIAGNTGGIFVRGFPTANVTGVSILGNSIYGNTLLGIDLQVGGTGVTGNDADDSDGGPNNAQNFPLLTSATVSGLSTTITGQLTSTPNTTFRVEFFASPSGHSSGHGEGQIFLGFVTVVTDSAGFASVDSTHGAISIPAGYVISATATVQISPGVFGDTSEFAANVVAVELNAAPVLDNSGTMLLSDIDEDAFVNTGVSVADLIASAGGDRITDSNLGAVEGIAVTGVDNTNGTWMFSIDAGTTWWSFAFRGVSTTGAGDASVVLLNDAARVRFSPATNYNGPAGNITFRAWDTTTGQPSGSFGIAIGATGGSTAFSVASETATLTVRPVNDAPVLTSVSLSVNDGQTVTLTPAQIGVTDPDSGSFTYSVTGLSGGIFQLASAPGNAISSFSSAQLAAGQVQFVDDGDELPPSFTLQASDGAASANLSNLLAATVTYTPVNDAPVLTSVTLSVNEGQTVTLTPAQIGVTDGVDSKFLIAGVASLPAPNSPQTAISSSIPEIRLPQRPLEINEPLRVQPDLPPTVQTRSTPSQAQRPSPVTTGSDLDLQVNFDVADFQFQNLQPLTLDLLSNGKAAARDGLGVEDDDRPVTREDGADEITIGEVAQAAGVALSAGMIWWALRAGGLLTGLLVSMPAWRHADLLAILPDDDEDLWDTDEDMEASRDEAALDSVLSGISSERGR